MQVNPEENNMAKRAKQVDVQVVTELDLISIETLRIMVQDYRRQCREAEARLEQQEAGVIERLRRGAPVQGRRSAVVTVETGPARPRWKELHVEHMSTEHGDSPKEIEELAQKLYPGKPTDVLVIGLKPPG
jgi:hypothetical protein